MIITYLFLGLLLFFPTLTKIMEIQIARIKLELEKYDLKEKLALEVLKSKEIERSYKEAAWIRGSTLVRLYDKIGSNNEEERLEGMLLLDLVLADSKTFGFIGLLDLAPIFKLLGETQGVEIL